MAYHPNPGSLLYRDMLSDIETGKIKVPQFQRKFVWTLEQTAHLIDSILKGYPIGTFIIWETDERLRSLRNLGGADFPETPAGTRVKYVLDGQQRMTSIYVALKGAKLKNEEGTEVDYSDIYIDLHAEPDDQIVVIEKEDTDESRYIRVIDLLNAKIKWLSEHYPDDLLDKIDAYKDAINTYRFPKVDITDAPIDVATEIFTRINVTGKALSLFEIMVAKTYDAGRNFDLSEKYAKLMEDLSEVDYGTVSDTTVLQAIAVILAKDCTRKRILKLDKGAFIDVWDDVEKAIKSAVDYMRTTYRIPVSQLLPYDALIVSFAYYFYHHPDKPLDIQKAYLEDYFWRCVLSTRFSSAAESKLTQDVKWIDDILNGNKPVYDYQIDITYDALVGRGYFSAGSAFIKGMLCILAYHEPKSFADNAIVKIANDWLRQANSKNYHHFFPRAYMQKRHPEVDYWRVNHIANITIVDDFLNKRSIRDRAPSKYMAEFRQKNSTQIAATMETHMISLADENGVFTDDYEAFFKYRMKRFRDELKQRVLLGDLDKADSDTDSSAQE